MYTRHRCCGKNLKENQIQILKQAERNTTTTTTTKILDNKIICYLMTA